MIDISIGAEEVTKAKEIIQQFDNVKTYNKFKCKNNYIGLLGEMVLHRFLKEHKVTHEWVDFIKDKRKYKDNIFSYPDFIIDNTTYDLKTTRSNSMWFQEPIHDIYIYANIDMFDTTLTLSSYDTFDDLVLAINTGVAKVVKRKNRKDYVIHPSDMTPIEKLIKEVRTW